MNKCKPLLERLMKHVDVGNGCWLWTASHDRDGYGNVQIDYKLHRAHRAMYELVVGGIPEGMQVLHRCDNPACVRPGHLWLGTNDENMLDKKNKMRAPHGDGHVKSKLNSTLVREMRAEYVRGYSSISDIAHKYKISISAASNAINGKTWATVK